MLNNLLLENELINYNPLVLCNNLFTISETETDIKGYWIDDRGKLYIDNIKIEKYFAIDTGYFLSRIKTLFANGEKCVFFKNAFNEGCLQYPNNKLEVLKTRKQIIYTCKPCELAIKILLKKYSGLTVYKIDNGSYLIEIYS